MNREYNTVITLNNDNHAPRVFINGIFVATLGYDLENVTNILNAEYNKTLPFKTNEIYIYDEEFEELDDEEFDKLMMKLQEDKISLELEINLVNKEYKKAIKII